MHRIIGYGLQSAAFIQLAAAAALSIALAEASGGETPAFQPADMLPAVLLAGAAVTSLVRARFLRR